MNDYFALLTESHAEISLTACEFSSLSQQREMAAHYASVKQCVVVICLVNADNNGDYPETAIQEIESIMPTPPQPEQQQLF